MKKDVSLAHVLGTLHGDSSSPRAVVQKPRLLSPEGGCHGALASGLHGRKLQRGRGGRSTYKHELRDGPGIDGSRVVRTNGYDTEDVVTGLPHLDRFAALGCRRKVTRLRQNERRAVEFEEQIQNGWRDG